MSSLHRMQRDGRISYHASRSCQNSARLCNATLRPCVGRTAFPVSNQSIPQKKINVRRKSAASAYLFLYVLRNILLSRNPVSLTGINQTYIYTQLCLYLFDMVFIHRLRCCQNDRPIVSLEYCIPKLSRYPGSCTYQLQLLLAACPRSRSRLSISRRSRGNRRNRNHLS